MPKPLIIVWLMLNGCGEREEIEGQISGNLGLYGCSLHVLIASTSQVPKTVI